MTNANCVFVGRAAGSNSFRVLLRKGFSGDPSSGTSKRSKSVASEVNAMARPAGDTLGEPLVARRRGERIELVGARVGEPEVRSRGRPIGARDDDVTVVGSPTEAGGHEARGAQAGQQLPRLAVGHEDFPKARERGRTGSQPEHQPGSIRRKSQQPARGGPPIERTSRVPVRLAIGQRR